MPRKPKPAYMLGQKGDKAKKGKKVNKLLQDHTVIIGGKHFHAPAIVKKNKIAKTKWLEIMKLYKETDLLITTNADVGLLERYCLTYSEYIQLMQAKEEITNTSADVITAISRIHDLRVDMKINQKNSLLLKMDAELFLTPLSKCRAVPRSPKKTDKKEEMKKKFNV